MRPVAFIAAGILSDFTFCKAPVYILVRDTPLQQYGRDTPAGSIIMRSLGKKFRYRAR